MASNCTSTWNGKHIRIDRLRGGVMQPVLARDLNAQDQDGESVPVRIDGDVVTFAYQGGIESIGAVPAIARYRVRE